MYKAECEGCTELCWITEPCPVCGGSGIGQVMAINSINSPTFYGLEHPLNLQQTCNHCGGLKKRIIYCQYYDQENEEEEIEQEDYKEY